MQRGLIIVTVDPVNLTVHQKFAMIIKESCINMNTFEEDWLIFLQKIRDQTLTKKDVAEFDKKYNCNINKFNDKNKGCCLDTNGYYTWRW